MKAEDRRRTVHVHPAVLRASGRRVRRLAGTPAEAAHFRLPLDDPEQTRGDVSWVNHCQKGNSSSQCFLAARIKSTGRSRIAVATFGDKCRRFLAPCRAETNVRIISSVTGSPPTASWIALYVQSVGPVARIRKSGRAPALVDAAYKPLQVLYNGVEPVRAFYDWYLPLWGVK